MKIEYTINSASVKQIRDHLWRMDADFTPSLHTYVDIDQYAEKLATHAICIEIFKEENLSGLMALYYNETEKFLYVSNFSLENNVRGSGPKLITGIARYMQNRRENLSPEIIRVNELILKCIEKIEQTENTKLSSIRLELQNLNAKAASFYQKLGFREIKKLDKETVYLILDL